MSYDKDKDFNKILSGLQSATSSLSQAVDHIKEYVLELKTKSANNESRLQILEREYNERLQRVESRSSERIHALEKEVAVLKVSKTLNNNNNNKNVLETIRPLPQKEFKEIDLKFWIKAGLGAAAVFTFLFKDLFNFFLKITGSGGE